MRLITLNKNPIGGWRYIHPQTKFKIIAPTRQELYEAVTKYSMMNLVWTPAWSDVEEFLCEAPDLTKEQRLEMKKSYCCEVGIVKRGMGQVLKGGVAVLKGIGQYVEKEVAEKRAKICEFCPNNQRPINKSVIRSFTDKLAETVTYNLSTSLDSKLFNCLACSCNLRAKIHYPQKVVSDSLDEVTYNKLKDTLVSKINGKDIKCWQVWGVTDGDK